ncbi:MAG: dihydrodipicolinate synthase family protein [Deltaproteobacteria bacterium]|nr:MAG: dihydrodipicolinate synthase family protein [Deltaproteobacteria bacterium]
MTPRALSTFCCSVTPFAADGSLDVPALRAHFARLAAAGVGVYVAGSSPGEGYALSRSEVWRCLEIAVQELRGRVPVRAMGVEPRTTREMIEHVELAAECGVDAVQIYSLDIGHGGRPDAATIERYFRTAIEACRIPCVVSSHHFIGYTLEPELMRLLADDYEQVIGFNVTSPDLPYHVRVLDALEGRAEVHVGGPMHALSALALGANGFLSTEANYAPRLCQSLIEHARAGDYTAAAVVYARILALMAGSGDAPGMSVRYVKAAMTALGHCAPHVREPHLPLGPNELSRVAKRLAELGISGSA